VKVVRAMIRLVGIRRRRQGRARDLQSLGAYLEIRARCFAKQRPTFGEPEAGTTQLKGPDVKGS